MADGGGKVELSKDVLAPADGPREDLIATAVKFLQNPKVRQSPLAQRKLFLERKGLTKVEIDAAVQRSGITEDDKVTPVFQPQVPQQMGIQPLPVPQTAVVPYTKWNKARDVLHTIALVGGLTYATYKFFKEFIGPYLLGMTRSGDRLDKVEKTVNDLQSNVVETLARISQTLGALQEMVTKQQEKMQLLSQDVYIKQDSSDSNRRYKSRSDETLLRSQDHQLATEIKSELTSIKGLLLNRRQFPPTPSTKSLPSWQLQSSVSTSTSSTSSVTTPTRSLVLPSPSGDADMLSKEANLNSNESNRDSLENEETPNKVTFSSTSLASQDGMLTMEGDDSTSENVTQQALDEDKSVSNEEDVKVENLEVKGQNNQNEIQETEILNDNEQESELLKADRNC